jgi:hypothetical protein
MTQECATLNVNEDTTINDNDDDDDGLGYYEDGVKRTLTDEQIAMFRHSELEAICRETRKRPAVEPRLETPLTAAVAVGAQGDLAKFSRGSDGCKQAAMTQKRKGGKNRKHEPKPDLRKRTWDVVEAGLDSLDYD